MIHNILFAIAFIFSFLFLSILVIKLRRRRLKMVSGDPAHRKRQSDVVRIENIDRVSLLQAERLKKEGNAHVAAKLFEEIGMVREAIETLEEAQSFQAAAAILLRIGLPNRAGALLERNNRWHEAIECYHQAKASDDIMRCVQAICKSEAITDPLRIEAEIFQAQHNYLPAARKFLSCAEEDKAYENFIQAAEHGHIQTNELNEMELRFIASQMGMKRLNYSLVDILKDGAMMQPLLVRLLNERRSRNATLILKNEFKTALQRQELLHDPALLEAGLDCLSELFLQLTDYTLAAKTLERLGKYEDAGRVAEVAQLYFVAAKNYALAGLDRKASEMRVLATATESESVIYIKDSQLIDITSEVEGGERPIQISNDR